MDSQVFLLLIFAMFAFGAWYSTSSKRNKILCTFRRVNKQKIEKWVRMESRYVIFDNGKYDILSNRIVYQWYTRGMFGAFFPTMVATLDYSHTCRWPLDPDTLKYTSVTPEVRKVFTKEEDMKAFGHGIQNQAGKKKGGIEGMLPWIAILLIGLLAFFWYQDHQMIKMIENTLRAMIK